MRDCSFRLRSVTKETMPKVNVEIWKHVCANDAVGGKGVAGNEKDKGEGEKYITGSNWFPFSVHLKQPGEYSHMSVSNIF